MDIAAPPEARSPLSPGLAAKGIQKYLSTFEDVASPSEWAQIRAHPIEHQILAFQRFWYTILQNGGRGRGVGVGDTELSPARPNQQIPKTSKF